MTIRSFDSFEDAQAAIAADVAAAKEQIKDFQRTLLDGKAHHFLKVYAYPTEVLLIVGTIPDIDEHHKEMLAKYGKDAEGIEEVEYETASMRDRLTDGFVFTNSFSVACPEGELGDQHVSTLLEITEAQFEQIKSLNFDLTEASQVPELHTLIGKWVKEVAFQ